MTIREIRDKSLYHVTWMRVLPVMLDRRIHMSTRLSCRCWMTMIVCAFGLVSLSQAQQQPPATGPWDRDLIIRVGPDGTNFGAAALFEKASGVPSLVKDKRGRVPGRIPMVSIPRFPIVGPRGG